jgi:hypothetical protein
MENINTQRYAYSLELLRQLKKEVCLDHMCTGKECFEINYCRLCETIGDDKVNHTDNCIMVKINALLDLIDKKE